VKRRFDYRIKTASIVYIDDYAHHPEELKATISAARLLYPDKKITGVFQPHLFSLTRDFLEDFAKSLDLLDVCILLPIYPARELPIEGIDSSLLLGKMKLKDKFLMDKSEVTEYLRKAPTEIVLTMGAGDIDSLVLPLAEMFKQKIAANIF
jgi:UDP-N-acetylmuramate--alanine ligase